MFIPKNTEDSISNDNNQSNDLFIIITEDLDIIEKVEYNRNYHHSSNKNTELGLKLRGKLDIFDVVKLLPPKVLIANKVYQFSLKFKGPNCRIYFTNRINEILEVGLLLDEDLENIENIICCNVPFKFHREDTAYVITEILRLLIDVDAIEVLDNLKLNGNQKIYGSLDYIMNLI